WIFLLSLGKKLSLPIIHDVNTFWLSLTSIVWRTIIAILAGTVLNVVIILGLYSAILLVMVISHIHTLSRLDQWLRYSDYSYSTVPDRSGLLELFLPD